MAGALSRDDVVKVANLAHISLTDQQIDTFQTELSAIIDYVKQLADVDISNDPPTNQVTGLKNVWREDKVIDYGYKPDELLKNVPDSQDGYIRVKRIIE